MVESLSAGETPPASVGELMELSREHRNGRHDALPSTACARCRVEALVQEPSDQANQEGDSS